MIYVIYVFAGIFILLGAMMFYVFYRERHFGMLLMAMTYTMSGLLAIVLPHWWPLVAGFVMVWMLKMLGLEMEPEEAAGGTPPSRDEGGGMRDEGKAGSEPPSRQQDR
jgi:hypothetical protein